MLTLIGACGASVVDPTPIAGPDDVKTAHLAGCIRRHLTDCPCGRVRITVWHRGRLEAEKVFTRDWLDDACEALAR